jgi:hypothetical protein
MYQPLHQQQQQQQQQHREHNKSKLISVVSSTKNETPGHAFRLKAVEYTTPPPALCFCNNLSMYLEQQHHVAVDVYGWGRRPSRDIGDGGV